MWVGAICLALLCGASTVAAGDDDLSADCIVFELKVATAWQPIQAPAVAVPRGFARGHSCVKRIRFIQELVQVDARKGGATRATLGYQQGRLVSAILPNGHTRTVSYQSGKLYQSIEQVNGLSWTTTYGWRSDDRLGSRTTPFESETYTYGADKLTGWKRTGRAAATASYSFDSTGHRISEEVVRSEGTQQVVLFTTAIAPLEASLGTWEATGTGAAGLGGVGTDALASLSPGSNLLTTVSATVSLPQPTTGWRGISLVANLTFTSMGDLVALDEWRA